VTITSTPTNGTTSVNPATGVVTYTPNANFNGPDSFTYTVQDNDGLTSAPATVDVTVNAVNDAPVNAVPATQTTPFNTPVVFSTANGNAISVADVDAGAGLVRVTLSVPSGTLTLGSIASLVVTGNGTSTVVATGTIANLNAGLQGTTFTPAPGTTGPIQLAVSTNDQGNTGGAPQSDVDTITINVGTSPTGPAVAAAVVQFSVAAITVDDTVGTVTLTITNPSGLPGSVNFTTQDGSARAGVDYLPSTGTVTFAAGEISKTITIRILPRTVTAFAPPHTAPTVSDEGMLARMPIGTIQVDQLPPTLVSFSVVLTSPGPGTVIGSPSAVTITVRHPTVTVQVPVAPVSPQPPDDSGGNNAAPRNERRGEPVRRTEQQRQEYQLTNRSNKGDVHTEGNVVGVTKAPDGKSLLVTIALIRDETLIVQVPCFGDGTCYDIQVGDYLEADGYQNGVGDPNDWFVASDGVTTWRNGHRVR
jgi:hypothetical protein